MGWYIQIRKKIVPTSLMEESDKILLSDWQKYVEESADLIWAEDSPASKAFIKEGHEWVDIENYRMEAYFEINRKGISNLRLDYYEGSIMIDCERQTLKRVEKIWEVAEYFNAYLFKNGTRFTLKKLEKLREKYNNRLNKK